MTFINAKNIIFLPITLFIFYFQILKDQTLWFRNQWLKYNTFGIVFAGLVFLVQCLIS